MIGTTLAFGLFIGEGVGNGYQADNAENQAENAVAQGDASVMDHEISLSGSGCQALFPVILSEHPLRYARRGCAQKRYFIMIRIAIRERLNENGTGFQF